VSCEKRQPTKKQILILQTLARLDVIFDAFLCNSLVLLQKGNYFSNFKHVGIAWKNS